jgi:putative transposase
MPGRKYPIITGETYHVFNRGINKQPTFISKREYERALKTILFYQYSSPPVKLSKYLTMKSDDQNNILSSISKNKLIDIHTFVLMPNHFHFQLTQKHDNGISKFIGIFQNSYTRYFNTKNDRDGSLFLDQFKAQRIEDDNTFLHIHRYIHLNPLTSYLVKNTNDLINYPWSSIKSYLEDDNDNEICTTKRVLSFFKSKDKYIKFILDHSDYQRRLDKIKHLTFETYKP